MLLTASVLASSFGSPIAQPQYSSPASSAYPAPAHSSPAYPSPAYQSPAYPSQGYSAGAKKSYEPEYPEAPAKYNFAYEVADAYSGDYKSQSEDRDGDYVKVNMNIHNIDNIISI